jgi:OOP family OmpA-OmpF porin
MFKTITTAISIVVCLVGQAQPLTKTPAVGIHLAFFDFAGADSLRSFGRDVKTGLAIHYQNSLSKRFDYSITLAGSFLDFMNRKNKSLGNGEKQLLLEADYSLRANLVKSTALFKPYVQGGAGVSVYNNYYGIFIPAGAGCQVNITKDVFMLLNSQFRIPLTNTQHRHFYHSLGLAGVISRKKISKAKKSFPSIPPTPAPVFAKPIDSDGDGLVDSVDQCPQVVGVLSYRGCPVPDTDKDGINDEKDKCPDIAGVAANGCPEVKQEIQQELKMRVSTAAQHIFFETNRYKILSKSYPALDEVVQILKNNPGLKLVIEGHTDNTGTPARNQVLSENRARSVLSYLVKSGISMGRLQAAGYGQQQPIADNSSNEGRATNRRVELKLHSLLKDK